MKRKRFSHKVSERNVQLSPWFSGQNPLQNGFEVKTKSLWGLVTVQVIPRSGHLDRLSLHETQ